MSAAVIPEPIAQLQLQLEQIRSTQPRVRKLPDSVWQAAVELAREHGVYSVAHLFSAWRARSPALLLRGQSRTECIFWRWHPG
jgi:hypothetical protein